MSCIQWALVQKRIHLPYEIKNTSIIHFKDLKYSVRRYKVFKIVNWNNLDHLEREKLLPTSFFFFKLGI